MDDLIAQINEKLDETDLIALSGRIKWASPLAYEIEVQT